MFSVSFPDGSVGGSAIGETPVVGLCLPGYAERGSAVGKPIADVADVGFSGQERLRGEAGFVGGVGIALAFERHSIVVVIDSPVFPFGRAVKPVAGVDLDSRLVGKDFETEGGVGR